MRCLADTNVLLRYVQQNHELHAAAFGAIDFLLRSGELVVTFPQNIAEFWNVCTRPSEQNGLGLTPSEADKKTSRLESLLTILPDIPAVYTEWRRLLVTYSASGVGVYDVRLVACMIVYHVKDIVTFNTEDFLRYSDIRVLHPTDIVPKPEKS
jgi:predicted nucleic acid-binding protein